MTESVNQAINQSVSEFQQTFTKQLINAPERVCQLCHHYVYTTDHKYTSWF